MNHVLYACDRNFLEPLYTSVYSLLCHIRKENTYVIHMILKDIGEAEKTRIQEMSRKFHQEIIFYDSPPLSGKLNISDSRSEATFYRMCAASILPKDVQAVLYIDGDTVLEEAPNELFETGFQEKLISGVLDTMHRRYRKQIGLGDEDCYLNAGVLMMNLKLWREERIEKQMVEYLESHDYHLPHNDQDVINHVCKGRTGVLPMRYNMITPFYEYSTEEIRKLYLLENFYREEERKKSQDNPAIIHYAGNPFDRPWNDVCDHPKKDRYEYYARKAGVNLNPRKVDTGSLKRITRKLHHRLPFGVFLGMKRVQGIYQEAALRRNFGEAESLTKWR